MASTSKEQNNKIKKPQIRINTFLKQHRIYQSIRKIWRKSRLIEDHHHFQWTLKTKFHSEREAKWSIKMILKLRTNNHNTEKCKTPLKLKMSSCLLFLRIKIMLRCKIKTIIKLDKEFQTCNQDYKKALTHQFNLHISSKNMGRKKVKNQLLFIDENR